MDWERGRVKKQASTRFTDVAGVDKRMSPFQTWRTCLVTLLLPSSAFTNIIIFIILRACVTQTHAWPRRRTLRIKHRCVRVRLMILSCSLQIDGMETVSLYSRALFPPDFHGSLPSLCCLYQWIITIIYLDTLSLYHTQVEGEGEASKVVKRKKRGWKRVKIRERRRRKRMKVVEMMDGR